LAGAAGIHKAAKHHAELAKQRAGVHKDDVHSGHHDLHKGLHHDLHHEEHLGDHHYDHIDHHLDEGSTI